MQIKYLGNTSFFIETDYTNILLDPYKSKFKINYDKYNPYIVILSEENGENLDTSKFKDSVVFDIQGEYEAKNTLVQMFTTGKNNIAVIKDDFATIAFLGMHNSKELPKELLESYSNIDVVIAPVSGENTMDLETATKLAEQLEPAIFIPMMYKESTAGLDTTTSLKNIKDHLSGALEQNTYKAKKTDFDIEAGMKTIILSV